MEKVWATLAALAVIGLLLALDPGGAIAESGFPDYRDMGWQHLIAWGFRVIGVAVALLIIVVMWLKYRPSRRTEYRDSAELVEQELTVLPAAAVSVLEDREVNGRTLLAAIVEMAQRGTLQLDCIRGADGYRYRLSQQGSAPFDWERLICDRLPSGPISIKALRDGMYEHKDAIGDDLGEFLQSQGLFHDNPLRVKREKFGEGEEWAILAGVLMGVGGGLWLALWLSTWWVNAILGAVIGFVYLLIASPMHGGTLQPTKAGEDAIGQWLGFRELLSGPDPADGGDDSMLTYAIALDAARPWLAAPTPRWFGSGEPGPIRDRDLNAAWRNFLSSPFWDLTWRTEGAPEPMPERPARARPERAQVRTARTEQAEETADPETAPEGQPAAGRAAAPAPEETLYQDRGVLLSRRILKLPDRTIALERISSVWADRQTVETGGSNWFLKAPGGLFMGTGSITAIVASGFFLWVLGSHVLHWLGVSIESCSGGPGSMLDCEPFKPNSGIAWGTHLGVIVMAITAFGVGEWLSARGTRKRNMYCAAVTVDFKDEAVYFGHSEEQEPVERLVEEVRKAHEATRSPDDASGGP